MSSLYLLLFVATMTAFAYAHRSVDGVQLGAPSFGAGFCWALVQAFLLWLPLTPANVLGWVLVLVGLVGCFDLAGRHRRAA